MIKKIFIICFLFISVKSSALETSAKQAYLIDVLSGEVLFEKNKEQKNNNSNSNTEENQNKDQGYIILDKDINKYKNDLIDLHTDKTDIIYIICPNIYYKNEWKTEWEKKIKIFHFIPI